MLKRIVDEKLLTARAVVGFWPAARVGSDDIEIYADDSRNEVIATFHHLRQQTEKKGGKHNASLADFIAPRSQISRTSKSVRLFSTCPGPVAIRPLAGLF